MGAWWILIIGAMIVGTHFLQFGYQGYADAETSLIAGVSLAAAYAWPIYHFSPIGGVAAVSMYFAGSVVYWGTKRKIGTRKLRLAHEPVHPTQRSKPEWAGKSGPGYEFDETGDPVYLNSLDYAPRRNIAQSSPFSPPYLETPETAETAGPD